MNLNREQRRREERRAVDEAGGGVSEGFELAEEELIEHASHSDDCGTELIFRHVSREKPKMTHAVYGEADDALPPMDDPDPQPR